MNKGDFPDDTFTENEVLACLESQGLKFKNGSRYILSQCPTHDDEHPSVQIYKDDWFVNCHSGCGRYHITKAFPQLRDTQNGGRMSTVRHERKATKVTEHKYTQFDLMDEWKAMPLIPRDHSFKGIPLDVLDALGWRWDEKMSSYFIPYFSGSKRAVPFAQWRHLKGDRRFTFLKDAKPTCYGTWNLDNDTLFVVEGTSDCAVLDFAAVPWIGLPSAASAELMKALAKHCKEKGITLVYAGDNDEAGDKLREALDSVSSYRLKQPPKAYKDWGDFLVAEGVEAVSDYCMPELFPPTIEEDESGIDKVLEVFPGAKVLKVADSGESKEQSPEPATLF